MRGLYLRFPGGRKKALTISYDDGVEQDIQLPNPQEDVSGALSGSLFLSIGGGGDPRIYPSVFDSAASAGIVGTDSRGSEGTGSGFSETDPRNGVSLWGRIRRCNGGACASRNCLF